MSFYGNVVNLPQFTFDKYYPNRYEMDSNVETDGVFIGRYVFIDYSLNANDNYQIDIEHNKISATGRSNNQTVWQKVWLNNQIQYSLVAEFQSNAEKPALNLQPLPPSMLPNEAKNKTTLSYNDIINGYTLRWQDPYQIRFNGLFDGNNEPIDFANIAGFNAFVRNRVDKPNSFTAIKKPSGTLYYEKIDGNKGRLVEKNDILEYNISLPGIGNIVSDFYDLLLSKDRDILKPITDETLIQILQTFNLEDQESLILDNKLNSYIYYEKEVNVLRDIYIGKIEGETVVRETADITLTSGLYRLTKINLNFENGKTLGYYWGLEKFLDWNHSPLQDGETGEYVNSILGLIKSLYERYREIDEANNNVFLTKYEVEDILSPFSNNWITDNEKGPSIIVDASNNHEFFEAQYTYNNNVYEIQLINELKKDQTIIPIFIKFNQTFKHGEKITLLPPPRQEWMQDDFETETESIIKNLKEIDLYLMNGKKAVDRSFIKGTITTLLFDINENKVFINPAIPTWVDDEEENI